SIADVLVRRVFLFVPRSRMYSSEFPGRSDVYTSFLPSGDQSGNASSSPFTVDARNSRPSASITCTAGWPVLHDTNASRSPSGDHAGLRLSDPVVVRRRTR